ncbi:MAG TPA: hypothetical protein VD794_09335 [Flavisolibacter sp.]|nr:hypothetical protein [Flavisolibacter sp.]
MRNLISERKLLWAAVFICLGMLFLSQVMLFSSPVFVSEKDLGLLVLALVLLGIGVVQVVKAVRSI